MKTLLNSSVIAVFAIVITLLAADNGFAQKARKTRGKVYTKAEVGQIIKRLEENLDSFKDKYDSSLDRSKLNDTNREDELMRQVKKLEEATDELRREFDRNDTWLENKNEVAKCLAHARPVDTSVKNRHLGTETEGLWAQVKYELNTLAGLYKLPKL